MSATVPSPAGPLVLAELKRQAEELADFAKRLGALSDALEASPAQRAALDHCTCELARVAIILGHYFFGQPLRPIMNLSGICRECGCTDAAACDGGCSWVNATHTLCSRCKP